MPRITRMVASVPVQLLAGAILAAVWGFFAFAHLGKFLDGGNASLLVFAMAESLIAAFFLLRTQPKTVTGNPLEWVIALLGTLLPLFLRPSSVTLAAVAEWGLILGATMQILGVFSLNRSFALVPALRELKTRGMYRFVRHPLYSSYLVTLSSYVLVNFSPVNLLICIGTIGLLILRIHFEERLLGATPEYRAYQSSTRWRLIPFVF
jgi:protein-S-isoprenylcysteine O-methyltransferase Ste14